jgi:putative Mg2+ transporter-C (MgtC) family protein
MREWLSWLSVEYADQIEMMLRLCGAAIAGMAVGINRDIHNKPIGMRTLGLVALGSAIVILSGSVYEGLHFGQDAVSRVIQGIMTGLGFLGAGAILRGRDEMQVHGLTTAATVWIAAGLGVTAGLGPGSSPSPARS